MTCSACSKPSFHPRVSINFEEVMKQLSFGTPMDNTTAAQFTQTLIDSERDLADCDDEMANLESIMISLRQRRERLKTYTTLCRSLFAPVRRLPPEVLSQIFLSHSRRNHFDLGLSLEHDLPSFTLSHVCRGWRDIALGTPRLWSSLSIVLNDMKWLRRDTAPPADRVLRRADSVPTIIRLCVERSCQAPLLLDLTLNNLDITNDPYHIVRDILGPVSSRWHTVSLRVGRVLTNEPNAESLFSSVTKMPDLECFETEGMTFGNVFSYLPTVYQTPQLRSMTVDSVFRLPFDPIDPELVLPFISWTRFTTLTLKRVHFPSCLEILRQCLSLSSLALCDLESDHRFSVPNSDHITLNDLRELILDPGPYVGIGSMIQSVFSRVTCPAIERLIFNSSVIHSTALDCAEWNWPIGTISDFAFRSGCSLSSLQLNQIPITDSECLSLLRIFPSLNRLDIREISLPIPSPKQPVTDKFLAEMLGDTSNLSVPLAYQLREMKLRVNRLYFDANLVLGVVHSRVDFLRSFCLIVEGGQLEGSHIYESVTRLENPGLRVEIFDV